MMRSARSLPNPKMPLMPALVIVVGLVSTFAVAGYWLMKPTVVANPGVAAYKAPAANVLAYGAEAKLVAAEQAAIVLADKENRKLGLAPTTVARTKASDDRVVAATPRQATARIQKRPDAPSPPRVARREPPAQSLFGSWRLGMF